MSDTASTTPVVFGKPARALFEYDAAYRPLNHGSYGTVPRAVREARERYQRRHEARVDPFRRFEEPALLAGARAAVAPLLGADVHVDEVVLVANATTGVNAVVGSLAARWSAAAGDTVLCLSLIYDACRKTLVAQAETGRLLTEAVDVDVLADSDDIIVRKVRDAHARIVAAGRHPRLLVVDAVASMPGVRLPWESLVAASRDLGMLSLVDAAHGIGQLDLHHVGRPDVRPDFLVTNCHKWLFVPRGCALLYVPFRNQHHLYTSLPTSHGYLTPSLRPPLPAAPSRPDAPNYFVHLFADVGTQDHSAYLCIPDAIAFRRDVCGGEDAIRNYCFQLAASGGDAVARILETEVMDHPQSNIRQCQLVNVRLPLDIRSDADIAAATPSGIVSSSVIPLSRLPQLWEWMQRQMVDVHNTFIPAIFYRGAFWARLSAQIYLDQDDFEWAGQALLDICQRANKGEWDTQKTEQTE
ncbi:aminotransferase family protein [Grosmannia clavigera kw1407]|uniref:Aminotransferase family protein n=1 Tax=Grosmannia clavigera (strain kw1407 / UAMH 11150) TaxID=655863 RepID=F0XPI8_GROCL|nr:aminotransferase family protein [Grosmannia clavigera kw1407]EFX00398.1 aminotransferase family protein [Grosmannia clavigera kw1407]